MGWAMLAGAVAVLFMGVGFLGEDRLPGPAWMWPRSKPGTPERTRRLLGTGLLLMGTSFLGFTVIRLIGLREDGGWIVVPFLCLCLTVVGAGAAGWAMWRSIRDST